MRNHLTCMANVIQLTLGAFLSSLGVNGHAKSWEAHEQDQQFGEIESTVIGMSQRLRKEGNAGINKVMAMRPGLANLMEKVHNRRHFERPETDLYLADNACCIDYSDTRLSKRVHWLSQCKRSNRSTTFYGCENMVGFDIGVTWVSLLITRIHLRAAQQSNMQ